MKIKENCIANIEKIKSELNAQIEKKAEQGKSAPATQAKLKSLIEFENGVWAKTLEWANDEWFSEFGTLFADSNVSKHTNPRMAFGEGFACLGASFDSEMSSNMWTK